MITDEVNRNRDFKYDHRNLITQIRNTKIVIEDSLVYATYYFYDEAGNRIRKKVYQYIGIQPSDSVEAPDIGDIGDMTGYWDIIKDEVYSRDLSGKEVAIYINGEIDQYPLYGLDMIGKIDKDITYYYLKDHLGSVRAVINPESELISGQDYDAWGYLLQGRQYDSDESKYKFTGKERDAESEYDYFGARYYDARVGRWGQVDPQLSNNPSFSPYNYTSDNPLSRIDPNGLDDFYYISGQSEAKKIIQPYTFEDRYFFQHESGNVRPKTRDKAIDSYMFYEANSEETASMYLNKVGVYNSNDVQTDWQGFGFEIQFFLSLPSILDERSSLVYALNESIGGDMDSKLRMSINQMYLFNGKVFNRNEAGNIVWGAVMNYLGFSEFEATNYAHLAALIKELRFDENYDQRAISHGHRYHLYNLSTKWGYREGGK